MTGERFVDVDGIRTRYFDKGSGAVLVLFHGSHLGTNDACESALDWELNFDRLAEWFRVIAVDKLGQGHTIIRNGTRIIRWPRLSDTLTGFFRRCR
jgi:pimeloyl-ACP methyl ester carboxylesterase